ncbi:MAG: hypothetical protein DRI37_06175 [Chloroflexi bacterium]|nr:MAG: hypothetical protein DRI37_06175 [Chloroflexota bacterium]
MVNKAKREEILQLLQDGKITLEEASQYLDSLEESGGEQAAGPKSRWLRIRVTDYITQKTQGNFSLPLSLVRTGLKLGIRFIPHLEGVDVAALEEALLQGKKGPLMDVMDEENSKHIEIYLD